MANPHDPDLRQRRLPSSDVVVGSLRVVLVAVLVTSWVVLAWTAPHRADVDDLTADLAAGRVEAVRVGELPQRRDWIGFGGSEPQLWWSSRDGPGAGRYLPYAAASGDDDLPWTADLRRARAAGVPVTTAASLADRAAQAWNLVHVLAVAVLVTGRQPRRATKWGWFWLLNLPYGIGVVWWLAREAPWSPTATRLPEPAPHATELADGRRRRHGFDTAVITIVLSLAIGVALLFADRGLARVDALW